MSTLKMAAVEAGQALGTGYEIYEGESGSVVKALKRSGGTVVALAFQHADQQRIEDTVRVLRRLAAMGAGAFGRASDDQFDVYVESLVGRPALSETKLLQARMKADAMNQVIQSGDLVKAADIARIAGYSVQNPSAQPNRWKRQGQTFAVQFNRTDYYPLYTLDPENGYKPYKAVGEVLAALQGKDAWGLAFWFGSVNGMLGGRRPQDVLASAPDDVIAAARDHAVGMQHG